MKHPHATTIAVFLAATLALTISACGHDSGAAAKTSQTAAAPVVPPPIGPTAERAVQRSQERWAKVTKGDLIAAYDFYVPEAKREQSLASFLTRMQVHKYEDARVVEVVGLKDNLAYLRVSTLWTPMHERAQKVKLEPGESLTQRISMIETWRFVDGDWCYLKPDVESDFFQSHPELLKKDDNAPSATADTHKPAGGADASKDAPHEAQKKPEPKQSSATQTHTNGDAAAH
jgi:hypothetical protein